MNILPRVIRFFSVSTARTLTLLWAVLLFGFTFNIVLTSQPNGANTTSRIAEVLLECNIDTTKNVTLQNSCSLTKRLDFVTPNVIFDGKGYTVNGESKYNIKIAAAGIMVQNITITNAQSNEVAIFASDPARNITIKNTTIQKSSHGIAFFGSASGTISQNKISVANNGITFLNSASGTITGNQLENNLVGIRMHGNSSAEIQNNYISNGTFTGQASGIALSANAKITNINGFPAGNTFVNNKTGNCASLSPNTVFPEKEPAEKKVCPDNISYAADVPELVRVDPESCYSATVIWKPSVNRPNDNHYIYVWKANDLSKLLKTILVTGILGAENSEKVGGLEPNTDYVFKVGVVVDGPTYMSKPKTVSTKCDSVLPTPFVQEREPCKPITREELSGTNAIPPVDGLCPEDSPICVQYTAGPKLFDGCVEVGSRVNSNACGSNPGKDVACQSGDCVVNLTKSEITIDGIKYAYTLPATCAPGGIPLGGKCSLSGPIDQCANWPNTWCTNSGPPSGADPTCQTKPATAASPTAAPPTATPTLTPCESSTNRPPDCGCTRTSQCSSGYYCKKESAVARGGYCKPNPTSTVSGIPGGTQAPTVTSSPTGAATTTTPVATQPPTSTTATPTTGNTGVTLALNLKLPGVGPLAPNNTNPHTPVRTATVYLYNAGNNLFQSATGSVSYDSSTGAYKGNVATNSIAAGQYRVEVKLDNTLQTKIPGIINSANATATLPAVTLVLGDIDQNNVLDLRDYNALLSCFGNKSCSGNTKTLADLNDDGLVSEKDLNILLRGFAIQTGD